MSEIKNGRHIDDAGSILWFKDDLLHREDGPAVEHADGDKEWFFHGKRHREDGPAFEYGEKKLFANGLAYGRGRVIMDEWWIDGKFVRPEDFRDRLYKFHALKKEKLYKKLHANLPKKIKAKRIKI